MSESSKTLECMVCGKTFSRGPVDLARHQNAVTLKHLVSTTASAQFSFRCRKCNIHFTSKEHLSLHRAQSSCGQPLSKPVPVTSTSAIIRPKPVKPLPIIINQAEESNIPPVLPHSSRGTPRHAASVATAAIAALSGIGHTKEKVPIPATPAQVSECGPLVTEKESNEGSAEVLGTRHSTRTRHPNPLVSPEGVYTSKPATPSSAAPQVTQSSSSANKETATTEAKSRRGRPPAAATQVPVAASIPPVSDTQKTRKKAMTIDELAEFQRTNKRQRVIIPEERKAYYALLSLLIDKDLWNKRNHPDTASSSESPKVHLKLETAISPSVNIITVGQSAQKVEISGGSSSSGDASRSHQGTQTGPLSPTEVKAASPGSLQLPSSHPITSNAAQSVPIKTPWVPPVYASEAEQEAAELLCYVPKEKLLLLKTIQTLFHHQC